MEIDVRCWQPKVSEIMRHVNRMQTTVGSTTGNLPLVVPQEAFL